MKKLIFTFNLILIATALFTTFSTQSMEKKDNKHINDFDTYGIGNKTISQNSISFSCSSILAYTHRNDDSNNDLLGQAKDDQSSLHLSSSIKKYNKDNMNGKTEAELLINSDYNENV